MSKSPMAMCLMAVILVVATVPLLANGQKEPAPVIQMEDQPRQFLAPANPDASSRVLTLPFSAVTVTAQGQVITAWTFTVFDSSGRVVSEQSRLETRDRGFFGELFNLGTKPQVEVPKELTWDGAYHRPGRPEDGTLVPDGNYTYQLTVVDSLGGRAQTPPFAATVKNSRVTIDFLRASRTVFAPQGSRKTLSIEQSGSREFRWEGQFLDPTGQVVRTVVWENLTDSQIRDVSPPTFSWDGRDDRGEVLPDGLYRYRLTGFNRAGATTRSELSEPLEINSRSGSVSLTSDVVLFSPKAIGAPTSVMLFPSVGSGEAITHWHLTVSEQRASSLVVWSQQSDQPVPDKVPFSGRSTAGLPLPEGTYLAKLAVTFRNGNVAESAMLAFRLALSPPQAKLTTSYPVFGGTGRAGVTLTFQGEPGIAWDLEILDAKGAVLRQYALDASGSGAIEFQGMDQDGRVFDDGIMTAKVSGRSKAGIPGGASVTLRKDSRLMSAKLEVSRNPLVPGKGAAGLVRITPVLKVVDSIERTTLEVQRDGQTVAKRTADAILPFWDWNGEGQDRKLVADGDYQVALEVVYSNGSRSMATTALSINSRFLDNAAPTVDLEVSSPIFAPQNVDGPQTLILRPVVQQGASVLDSWSVKVLDPRGSEFRVFSGLGEPPARLEWDGKSNGGVYVESGQEYQLTLEVKDRAGRTAKKSTSVTVDILVDKLPDGRYKIVISSIQFSGYSSDVFKVPQPLLSRNLFVLQRLASVLNRLPGYRIGLEGYAVAEYSDDPINAAREQELELIPLSLDRAQEVSTALVLLGVDENRFSVKGLGSLNPVVPNTDLENRWKNRRVEFSLEKTK